MVLCLCVRQQARGNGVSVWKGEPIYFLLETSANTDSSHSPEENKHGLYWLVWSAASESYTGGKDGVTLSGGQDLEREERFHQIFDYNMVV